MGTVERSATRLKAEITNSKDGNILLCKSTCFKMHTLYSMFKATAIFFVAWQLVQSVAEATCNTRATGAQASQLNSYCQSNHNNINTGQHCKATCENGVLSDEMYCQSDGNWSPCYVDVCVVASTSSAPTVFSHAPTTSACPTISPSASPTVQTVSPTTSPTTSPSLSPTTSPTSPPTGAIFIAFLGEGAPPLNPTGNIAPGAIFPMF
ncbi:hypothetical protein CYMTET_12603 [Cymbomonas tetramitiformis]|uniref:Uncharacterized protein n=1 Tax=Cymbomonas tetramitiformis TaxID=36881 RepID=A0AAE0GK39_9CHLO|nr:hypothetical protein CYMTET_12603 [Cymbomonas tetramitiformis]